jgi:hypothetical protein
MPANTINAKATKRLKMVKETRPKENTTQEFYA